MPTSSSPQTEDATFRVLHVDDDHEFTEMVSIFLAREDDRFAVTQATSASNGLDQLSEQAFDCVISDYDMPGCTGIEFLQVVREKFPHLPFVLFTGNGTEEVASDAISAGVTDYLRKRASKCQYSVLANTVSNAIEHYRSVQMVGQCEQHLRAIIDHVTDAIVEVDSNWRFSLVNRQAEEFYEMDEESLIGRDSREIFAETFGTRFEEEVDQVMDTRESTSFVEQFSQTDGWFEVETHPTLNGGIAFYLSKLTEPPDHPSATE